MKRKRLKSIRPAAVAAVGVLLGRGAQADTILTFDTRPPGQGQNVQIQQTFGDGVAASGPGVTVTGAGTPDISLTWQATGGRWDYYIDTVWSGGQLDGSDVGDIHEIVFTPKTGTAAVIKSLNFHPYYDNGLDYTYDWRVTAGGTVLTNGSVAFTSDGTKNHPVAINFQGTPGQELVLQLERTGGADGSQNIAIDDVRFAQLPEPTGPGASFLHPTPGQVSVAPEIRFAASIRDGSTTLNPNTVLLSLNGAPVQPSVNKVADLTSVQYAAAGLLPAGTNLYRLAFRDSAGAGYTNDLAFSVAGYVNLQLPAPIVLETFEGAAEGGLPAGWTQTNYTEALNTDLDLGNLDSASYAGWTAVAASRFTNGLVGYSDPMAGLVDYSRVLSSNPSNVVNGAYVRDLATGRFAIANSGYRNGRSQVQYLYSPDYDLTGRTNVHLSFHSLWEQNQDSIALVEYSVDRGTTWLPVTYLLDGPDILLDGNNAVDPVATLSTEGATAGEAIAFYTDPADGQEKGGTYGAFVGVAPAQWPTLAPYLSPRVNDDPVESKRVELFRLAQADNRPTVRLRFGHAGSDSWYFGIDDVGLYSIGGGTGTTGPTLGYSLGPGGLTLSWPAGETGYQLQEATALPASTWGPVGGVVNNSVTVPIQAGNRFYRLFRPAGP